jgi:HAD superfamily hydrolase (TIGR01509 family)
MTKPHPDLFDAISDDLSIGPAQILLIDDSAQNVFAAQSKGWNAIQYQSPPQLLRNLDLS